MPDAAIINFLTIHLARSGFSEEDLINSSSRFDEQQLILPGGTRARLLVQQSAPKTPDWAHFFAGYVDVSAFGKNCSAGAALLVRRDTGYFALTFGDGRFLIDGDRFEENFGLKVALNCIGEDTIRSIDKHSLDQLLRHTREQASRDATPHEFGFDVEQDLLRAVTGKPTDARFGERLTGSDSLHINIPMNLAELPDLLDLLHEKFSDTAYQSKFPWIDQIAEVRDSELEEKLNTHLMERMAAGDRDRIWMAVPQLISWAQVKGFRYPSRKRSPEYLDINLDHFLMAPGFSQEENAAALMSRKIVCVDYDGRPLYQWKAHKCTYAELEYDGASFLLSSGKCYRVNADFVEETNAAYERIPDYESAFLAYADASEAAYLERIAAADNRFALMDQKTIRIASRQSPVEFCDLFSREKDIIHVKRYGQSSVFSHLFAQGLVSGQMFQMEKRFREAVNDLLPTAHKLSSVHERPKQNEFRVVYAVVSDGDGVLKIPFFSRLNLKNVAKHLQGYGFRIAKAKIPVRLEYRKTTKYPRRTRGVGTERRPAERVLVAPARERAHRHPS